MYQTLSDYYRKRFGCKVYKLAITGGFTCPNRDGTVGVGGCTFCAGDGSGAFAEHQCASVAEQLKKAKLRVKDKIKDGKFIAYFQSFSNTYDTVERLETLYLQAIQPEDIVGLSIATRPDCLPHQTIELLARINKIKPVFVELGLQTIHDETAKACNRCYETAVYLDALQRLKEANLEVVTHIILGLPGENKEMMLQTTRTAVDAGTNGVKFHLLHVLKGTALEKDYNNGLFECLTLEQYADILKDCLAILPEHVIVHRITGDGAKKDLIAPLWSADKKRVLNYLHRYINTEN